MHLSSVYAYHFACSASFSTVWMVKFSKLYQLAEVCPMEVLGLLYHVCKNPALFHLQYDQDCSLNT